MKTLTISKERGAVDYTSAQRTLAMWLQTCPNGRYTLSLRRVQQKRSRPQNNLMWMWFDIIAQAWSEATGQVFTSQEVHDAYCLMFLPKSTPKGRVAGNTSTLTTEQMADFLSRVQADAQTEYGISLPDPDDQYYEAMAEYYSNQ
ncbi:MAG: hypothetical protein IJ640_00150 [Prevotella sp.]|nr:hypothetical protein [Prevotella sp.]